MQDMYLSYVYQPAHRARRVIRGWMMSVVLVAGGLTGLHANSQSAELPDFTAIAEKAEPAVVNIRTAAKIAVRGNVGQDPSEMFRHFFGPDAMPPGAGRPGPQQGPRGRRADPEERSVPRGVGSGFFISEDGYLLTNHHVVADATEIYVTLTNGKEFTAKVIGSDERTDVALLKIDAKGMAMLPIGNAKQLKKGQWVMAIGSPFGLDSTVTSGIVSALSRDTGEYLPFIQTDVAVNPGNSGGPLLNMNGEVVGINSQIVSRSGGFMGISLAIPINEAMTIVEQLRANGKVTRGRIGVQIGEVTKDVAMALGLQKAEGAMVSGVEQDAPADQAGILPGDVITSFSDKPISKWSDLPRLVGEVKPGTRAPIEVWRKGKALKLSVTVAEIKPDPKLAAKEDAQKAEATSKVLGLGVVAVDAQTQTKLRIKGGVKVTSVEAPASGSGFTPGDIILAVGDIDITGPEQFAKIVSAMDKSKPVALMVRSSDQTRWVTVQPVK